jgi:predicted permease
MVVYKIKGSAFPGQRVKVRFTRMDHTIDIFNRVLPILILIGLGHWIRRSNFLSESTMEDLKKIAVNMALPAVLFLSFLYIELKLKYFVIFVVLFGLCVGLFQLAWMKSDTWLLSTWDTRFSFGSCFWRCC